MVTSSWQRPSEFDNHIWNEFSFIMKEVDMCHSNGAYKQSGSRGWVQRLEEGRWHVRWIQEGIHMCLHGTYRSSNKVPESALQNYILMKGQGQAKWRVACGQRAASGSRSSWPWAGLEPLANHGSGREHCGSFETVPIAGQRNSQQRFFC